jgi:hypothetical protein
VTLDALGVVRLVISLAYSLAVGAVMINAGEPTALWWWFGFAGFYAWCLTPIILPLFYPFRSWLITIGVAAIAAYSSHVYIRDMFGPGARSTSGLIFLFLPVYQWIAVAGLLGVALMIRRFVR